MSYKRLKLPVRKRTQKKIITGWVKLDVNPRIRWPYYLGTRVYKLVVFHTEKPPHGQAHLVFSNAHSQR